MTDQFGVILGRTQIEQAIITLLQSPPPQVTQPRIVYYLAAVERAAGLTPRTLPIPPGPSSYKGGVDARTLRAEWMPMIHVLCQPAGDAERLDKFTYAQAYQLEIVCTYGDDDEDTARMVADHYGAAVAKLIIDEGSLGGIATDTAVTRAADVELLDANENRQVCRSTVMIDTLIAPILTVGGPVVWGQDPYAPPADWPTVETVNVTITAVPNQT